MPTIFFRCFSMVSRLPDPFSLTIKGASINSFREILFFSLQGEVLEVTTNSLSLVISWQENILGTNTPSIRAKSIKPSFRSFSTFSLLATFSLISALGNFSLRANILQGTAYSPTPDVAPTIIRPFKALL